MRSAAHIYAHRGGDRRSQTPKVRGRWLSTVGPTLVLALGAAVVASAQSSSPFASQKKTQAWETQTAPSPAPQPAPPVQAQPRPPVQSAPLQTSASPQSQPDWTLYQPSQPPAQPAPAARPSQPSATTVYTSPIMPSQPAQSYAADPYAQPPTQPYQPYASPQSQPYADPSAQAAPTGYAPPPRVQPAPQPRGWADRLGFGSLSTLLRGRLRGGAGARERDGWEETFVADGDVELEVSAVTQGGLEYGVNLQARAQYDEGRKGFTRRLPDCPPTLAGCASVLVDGVPVALRGHTSQFYTSGPDVAKDAQVALESAHLFLRSAYGDVTVGRDDGAAYLFSLGAPTLMAASASNSPVDYTGLDAVKTVNDASGFAGKVTYTSPRLLGDRIGVGVQVGASYAPDPYVCGVDYCVDRNDVTNVLTPDLKDVMEVGVALDRTFANGLSVEGTVTYARASEQSGLDGFDDLSSVGAGLEVSLEDWTVGGSWLNSNQGLANGDYEAWDIGLTWKPSVLGFTVGYGHATDDLVSLTSDQIMAGVTWDYSDSITLGAGVQHADRESLRDVGGIATLESDKATAVFVEAGITF